MLLISHTIKDDRHNEQLIRASMLSNDGIIKQCVRLSKLVDIFRMAKSLAHPKLHTRVSGLYAGNNHNLYIL